MPGFLGEPAVSTKDASCGGLRDAPCPPPTARVTFYGGYQHVDQSNPADPQSLYSGNTTVGGYKYVATGTLAFGSDRTRDTAWAGATYEDGPWRFAGAWYYYGQNSYLTSSFQNCTQATNSALSSKTFVGIRVGSNCSAGYNQGSFMVDYTVNKQFDIYGGVTFADQTCGFNSGSLADNSAAFISGIRVKW